VERWTFRSGRIGTIRQKINWANLTGRTREISRTVVQSVRLRPVHQAHAAGFLHLSPVTAFLKRLDARTGPREGLDGILGEGLSEPSLRLRELER